mmetsp:Transcript_4062/g.6102  ORF Transcript_4062/g.6102 Transcript_4062/m.6102 type:complete len:134 (+) Transcript_4062:90-491(+)
MNDTTKANDNCYMLHDSLGQKCPVAINITVTDIKYIFAVRQQDVTCCSKLSIVTHLAKKQISTHTQMCISLFHTRVPYFVWVLKPFSSQLFKIYQNHPPKQKQKTTIIQSYNPSFQETLALVKKKSSSSAFPT